MFIPQQQTKRQVCLIPNLPPKWTIQRETFQKDGKTYVRTTKTLTEYGKQDLLRFARRLEAEAKSEDDYDYDEHGRAWAGGLPVLGSRELQDEEAEIELF